VLAELVSIVTAISDAAPVTAAPVRSHYDPAWARAAVGEVRLIEGSPVKLRAGSIRRLTNEYRSASLSQFTACRGAIIRMTVPGVARLPH